MRELLMQSLSLIKKELELLRPQQKISKEVANVSYKRYRLSDDQVMCTVVAQMKALYNRNNW